jgi:hypothetical protein
VVYTFIYFRVSFFIYFRPSPLHSLLYWSISLLEAMKKINRFICKCLIT